MVPTEIATSEHPPAPVLQLGSDPDEFKWDHQFSLFVSVSVFAVILIVMEVSRSVSFFQIKLQPILIKNISELSMSV